MWRKDLPIEQQPVASETEESPPAQLTEANESREQAALPAEESPRQLILLNQAQQALAQATSLDEIKDIRDKAEAARQYVQNARLGLTLQNYAAEVKLRAERRAGALLAQLKLAGGDRRSKTAANTLTLDDLGINKHESSRWQQEAAVPEDVFERFLQETNAAECELTTRALLRLAREFSPKKQPTNDSVETESEAFYESIPALREAGMRFGCIYLDPPLKKSEEDATTLVAPS